jgi:hypothetical protein
MKRWMSWRSLFWAISLMLLILMPLLSLDYGITGDEQPRTMDAVANLHYFLYGPSRQFMHRLNDYGIFFDLIPTVLYGIIFDSIRNVANYPVAWMDNVTVSSLETIPYWFETRHVINSLFGWACILFTGLAAQLLGGWRLAVLAQLILALSPRFFGHCMNNPKDIPLAMGMNLEPILLCSCSSDGLNCPRQHLSLLL